VRLNPFLRLKFLRLNQFRTAQILILIFVLLSPAVSSEAEVTPTPNALTITTARQAIEERNLLIQTTKPLKNLKVIALDLNRSDSIGVIPAIAIRSQLQAGAEIAANDVLSIPITVDLSQSHVSGEFTGFLIVKFDEGQYRVPMTVKVKDHFVLPLMLLIIGVGVGVRVSVYLQEGRNRDEIIVQMSRLRSQIRADQALAQSFQNKVNDWLIDVETALENQRWELAQKSLENAQAVWSKWNKGREDWLVQLAHQKKLLEEIKNGESFDPNSLYLQTLIVSLEDAARAVADYETPQRLRQTLVLVIEQMNRYSAGCSQLYDLNQQRNELPSAQAEIWRQKAQNLRHRLNHLSPNKADDFAAWEKDMATALEDVLKERQQSEQESIRSGGSGIGYRSSGSMLSRAIAPVPSARDLRQADEGQQAKQRLQLFSWLAWGIALCLLAGTGFQKLYVANPIFGANPFGDYFSLVAWGFGSEATRQSIAKVVRGWGMPDKGEKGEKAEKV
jgi:hypothetical protein